MSRRPLTTANILDRIVITVVPLVIGVITGVVTNYIIKKTDYQIIACKEGMELIKTIIDIWGILLGFIITAVSILLTVGENSYINNLIETNHMQNIIFSYIMSSVYLFCAIAFSIVLLFIKTWNGIIFVTFVGVNAAIGVSVAICIWFLFAIVLGMQK